MQALKRNALLRVSRVCSTKVSPQLGTGFGTGFGNLGICYIDNARQLHADRNCKAAGAV